MAGQIVNRGERTWLVRVPLGRDASGKRKYHNRTIHGTRKDAQRYLNQILVQRDTGTFVEPSRRKLAEYLQAWISDAKPGLRDRTRASYRWVLERYIIPPLGGRRMDQLRPGEIQKVYADMGAKGLSSRTIRYTHAILSSALAQAVKWGYLARNPADVVELPAKERKEMKALSPAEAAAFLRVAESDRWAALWVVLVTTGLRPGEALALKWEDIDWAGRRLGIQRVLVRQDGKGWSLAEPKTDKSRRTVTLPESVLASLQRHRIRQAEEKLRAGATYKDHHLVFANQLGGPLDYRVVMRRHFRRLLENAGLPPIRPYDLRHTCATLLLAAGEHPKVVSERLGHSSTVMTMDVYSHVLPDMQQASAEKLERLLFG